MRTTILALMLGLAAGSAEAQSQNQSQTASKARLEIANVAPTFSILEPGRGARDTGAVCEGDGIKATFYVQRVNGTLTASGRPSVLLNNMWIIDSEGSDGSTGSSGDLSKAINTTTPRDSCVVGTKPSTPGCTFADSDFVDGQVKVEWTQYESTIGRAEGSRNLRVMATDFPDDETYPQGHDTTSPAVSVTKDSLCQGLNETTLPRGGDATFRFNVLGQEYCHPIANTSNPNDCTWGWKWFSTFDYEIVFTPTQPDEAYTIFIWYRNWEGAFPLRGWFVAHGGTTTARLPFDVWGSNQWFSISIRHEKNWGTGDSAQTTVGFTLSINRIEASTPIRGVPAANSSSWMPNTGTPPAKGAVRRAVVLTREQSPPELYRR